MSRGIRISTILLSAILISSCATDRIQVARQVDLACKTPKTRYDYGRSKSIRTIKSNSSKYTRYAYHEDRNNNYDGYSSKNITRKDKHPEKLIYSLGETGNYNIVTHSGIDELMFFRQILNSSEINLYHYELKKLPDPVRIINVPEDIIDSPSQEDILFPINKVNNESGYSSVVLKHDDTDDIISNEPADEASISILNPAKSDQSQKTPFQKNETFILMMAILAGLIPLGAIKATPKLASNISFWAATNPWKTRFMSAGIQIALGAAGVMLGEKLAYNGIHFSNLSKDVLLGAFLTSSVLYPVKNTSIRLFKHSYIRQKTFDLALALSGLMLMVYAGNDPGMRASLTKMVSFKGHEQQNLNMMNDNSQAPKQLVYYQNDKQVQNEQIAPQKKKTRGGSKGLLTVLVVIATLGLGYLLALASCEIYCNGMVGLSAIVGIGGGVLLIVLAVGLIKSIWHPKPKNRIKPSETNDPIPQGSILQT
jgi:hypothetical protein